MLFARGLGFGALNPATTQTAQVPGGTASTGAPISHDNRITRQGITELVRRVDVDLQNRYLTTKSAMSQQLTAAQTGSCNSAMLCTIWGGAGPKIFGRRVATSDQPKYLLLYPLGTFVVLDVPFNVSDVWPQIQAHKIYKEFSPTPETRLRVVQQLIAQLDHDYGTPGDDHSSVVQVMKKFPELSLLDEGTGIAPPYPTDDEFNNRDGLQKFYARGGWFHSQNYTHGRKAFYRTYRTWGQSYCFCGTAPAMKLINTAGAVEWDVKLTMGPSAWAFAMEPTDIGLLQKAIGGMAKVLSAFEDAVCAAAGAGQITAVEKNLISEQCTDVTTNKACTKGSSTSCICTKPTSAQQAAVGLQQFAVQQICAHRGTKLTPVGPPTPPPQIFAPPGGSLIPWWLVIGLGVAGGAVLFSRRRSA